MKHSIEKLFAGLTALVLLSAWMAPASASTILVREEFGFSFFPGTQWVLEEDGATAIFDLSSESDPGARFELRYADDLFTMTALGDNTVATTGGLPFGIDVYPGNVTPVTPDFNCAFATPCYNGLGFFSWMTFPLSAGEVLSLAVPPVIGAVSEPATLAVIALGLFSLAWRYRAASAVARLPR